MSKLAELLTANVIKSSTLTELISVPRESPPPHLGDVMSSTETSISLSGDFSPLERILLTANGSLQRILSAYYNKPIKITIVKNIAREDSTEKIANTQGIVYDREVDISCDNNVICKAESVIKVSEPRFIKLLKDEKVGVGQLFRYINVLPEFKLLEVGRNKENSAIYRIYTLSTIGILCIIREDFAPNLLDLF